MKPKAPHAHCEDCPLQNRPLVPSFGPDKADYIIIGEAPGRDEARRKKPFVGKAGKLLDKVLKHNGIEREDVFVTNACLCHPVGNKTPNTKAVMACRDRLIAEVSSRDPKRILAVGKMGANAILDSKDGIGKLRIGGPKQSPLVNAEVVPTFHTAYALRNPDIFPSIVRDVAKLTKPVTKWEPTKLKVVNDVNRAIDLLNQQRRFSRTLVLDVENDHLSDQATRGSPDWLCIGISHRPGGAVVYSESVVKDRRFQQALAIALADKKTQWGFHRGQYDIQKLWSFAPEARVDKDTLLAHYATDERVGTHDLEQVSTELLGIPNYKADMRSHLPKGSKGSLRDLPTNVLHLYNATDTDSTHRLIEPLEKEMAHDEVTEVYERFLIPGTNVLARVENYGITIDADFLGKLEKQYSVKVKKAEEKFRSIADINPRSPQQVKKFFQDEGFRLKSTNKDDPSFKKIKHPLKNALQDYRGLEKLYTTYIIGIMNEVEEDGRAHPNFNLNTTETGRLSSSNFNAQNVPHYIKGSQEIRDAFVADDPDHVLLNIDYSQIEYRLLAVFSEDEFLLKGFREGRSFHKEIARGLFGDDYNETQYKKAKNTNFGIAYEQTAWGLASKLNIPEREAQKLIDAWYARCPRVKPYQEKIKKEARENGYLTSYFGRKRRFWLITAENWNHVSREALNFPLQSPASDFTLDSLIKLEPILRGTATPRITVHDSLVFNVHRKDVYEVAQTAREVMEATEISGIVPTPVEFSIGYRWGSSVKWEPGEELPTI